MKSLLLPPWFPRDIKRRARESIAQGKLLNFMEDSVFKAVLTDDSEDSREALRFLLSSCTHRPVSSVKVLNNELLPEYLTGKTIRLDVHVTFNDGEQADLEMQVDKSGDDLKARAAFYASRLLSGQAKKGAHYREIKRVYQIFFINGIIFPESSKFPRRYSLIEETEHEKLNELMEIIFYELPKLEKKVEAYCEGKGEIKNLPVEEKWCIYMKYRQEEGKEGMVEELCREEEGIMRVEKALAKVSRDEEKWARALFREKAEMDYRSGMYTARMEGKAEGEAAGIVKGQIRGEAVGYERAMLETARKMKETGMSVKQIQAITGLSPEIVEKL